VHPAVSLGKWPTWRTNPFQCIYLFTSLYMYRARRAHHQEREIVSVQLLVTVTLCWWQCCVLVGMLLPTNTRHCRDRIPVGARFSTLVQTSSGAHPASCTIGTGTFLGVKVAAAWHWPPTPSSVMCWLGVYSQPKHDTATNTEWQLPEALLIRFLSPYDEHDVLDTCREL
jgi:hypothetical protein